ncbi:MAG: DUF1801 domain-containing protein [Marinosulfonomonas sp.]|nr:DUF1801 domain-containing protein [Marinosulfonomonas sp.]
MEHKLLISLRRAHIKVKLWRRVAQGAFSNAAKNPTLTLKTRAGCVITPTSQLYSGNDPIIGPLTEVLKWGEPSYLTEVSKSGTTVRIPWHAKHPDKTGLFLNCKTTLVDIMREIYPDTFTYQGTRAVLFALDQPLPNDALAYCCEMALTYHRNKR